MLIVRILAIVVVFTSVASCGVDGPPIRPEPEDKEETAAQTGSASGLTVTVSGDARMGVGGRL